MLPRPARRAGSAEYQMWTQLHGRLTPDMHGPGCHRHSVVVLADREHTPPTIPLPTAPPGPVYRDGSLHRAIGLLYTGERPPYVLPRSGKATLTETQSPR